ncbi:MAG: sulfur oxidation c-type cytochrome SoxA [Alphaproteobacteria bacterium]|nr:MAG: sulfur oxidation c-type cytochrome SoxA [Alphaproteobacteria bacterium]
MRTLIAACASAALCLGAGTGAAEGQKLVIEGQEMVTRAPAPDWHPLTEVISGWEFRDPATQALQMDDFENPAMIFVDQAREMWSTPDGAAGKSCESCHGAVEDSMKGVRAVMPKFNEEAGTLWSLEDYINNCRTARMQAEPWKWSGSEMTAMTALITLQSRGMPVAVRIDGPYQSWWEKGREIYYTRYGQLELACANCHEDHYGQMIRADRLSQGQINGFPTYRLKNAKLNSIHNRFYGCIRDTRGVPFAEGSDEFKALELYVASRGLGLSIEGPAVRN